jgi:uncharacterized protein (TIGR02246 family)
MKKITHVVFILTAVMFVLGFSLTQVSCSRPGTFDAEQVQKSIEEACAKYSEAIRAGNVAGIVDVYTDDATILPPGGEIVKGRQAIGEFYKQLLQMGMKDIVFTTIEVGGSGDVAYEIGTTKVRIQPEGLEAIADSTKYLVIWKRQADATWKVYVDIFNFSTPMAGK